jgi:hypothetical protein
MTHFDTWFDCGGLSATELESPLMLELLNIVRIFYKSITIWVDIMIYAQLMRNVRQ